MGIHEQVTTRILAELEKGTAPWAKPWAVPMPYNAASSRRYNGVNVLLLWNTPYPRPAWLTFHQAQGLGGHVRKGEHATQIVYVATGKKPDDEPVDEKKQKPKRFPFLTRYFVFNVEQVDGLPKHLYAPALTLSPDMDSFFSEVRADVRHGGAEAYYDRRNDVIQVPHPEHFTSLAQYYATRLHETIHWTGHPSRLDREFGKRFGDQAYAFEELVAELGSAFLSAELGLTAELHHAEYIGKWIEILSRDRQAIFMAAARATYAAAYLKRLTTPEVSPESSAYDGVCAEAH